MLYFAYIYIYIRTFKEMDAPKKMDTSRSLARISERWDPRQCCEKPYRRLVPAVASLGPWEESMDYDYD